MRFCDSSSSTRHAFTSTHSTTSCPTSSLASPSSNSSSSTQGNTRCEGLDLLVEAVLHIAGSVVLGVPFRQKKVVRRRKSAFRFPQTVKNDIKNKDEEKKVKNRIGIEVISKPNRRRRVMALPSKYQDSVLQPWKRQTRRRLTVEIDGSR